MSLPGKWRAAPVVEDMARSAHIGHMARSAYVETHGAGTTATTGVRGRQASRRRFVARAAAEQRKLETAGPSATCTAICHAVQRVLARDPADMGAERRREEEASRGRPHVQGDRLPERRGDCVAVSDLRRVREQSGSAYAGRLGRSGAGLGLAHRVEVSERGSCRELCRCGLSYGAQRQNWVGGW